MLPWRQMLAPWLAVAMVSMLVAPIALACGDHAAGEPCSAGQPGAEYKAFMAQQRADILADFAVRAAARQAAQHQHLNSPGRRRMLSPLQPRPQLQAEAAAESQPEKTALHWSAAADWYRAWRSRLATEQIPELFGSSGSSAGSLALAEPQTAGLAASAGVSIAADLMTSLMVPQVR
jgi:hypothetical protein